jgi:hypothetical protein
LIFLILITFLLESCKLSSFSLKTTNFKTSQKQNRNAQVGEVQILPQHNTKIIFVMTQRRLYAGTFLLSELINGKRNRIGYIQNGTPVKVEVESIDSNISEFLTGKPEPKFIKIQTYTN